MKKIVLGLFTVFMCVNCLSIQVNASELHGVLAEDLDEWEQEFEKQLNALGYYDASSNSSPGHHLVFPDEIDDWEKKHEQQLKEIGYTLNNSINTENSSASKLNTSTENKKAKPCQHTYVEEIVKEPSCIEVGRKKICMFSL